MNFSNIFTGSNLEKLKKRIPEIFSGFAFFCYLILGNRLRYAGDFNDETEKLVSAEMIANGHHMYWDVFSQHGPMGAMLAHVTFMLTKANDIAVYRFVPMLMAIGICAAFLWGPLIKERRWKLISMGVFLVMLCLCQALWGLNMGMYQVEAGYFFGFALLLLVLPVIWNYPFSRIPALIGGASLVFAFFCAYSFVIGCFFMFMTVLARMLLADKETRPNLIKWTLWGILGGVIALGIMLLWLFLYGDIKGYFIYHIWFNQTDYASYAFANDNNHYNPFLILKMMIPVWGYFFIIDYARYSTASMPFLKSVQSSEVIYIIIPALCTLLFLSKRLWPSFSKVRSFIIGALLLLGIIYTNPRGAWDFHASTMVVTTVIFMAVVTGLCWERFAQSRIPCMILGVTVALTIGWFIHIQNTALTYIFQTTPIHYHRMRGMLKESDAPVFKLVREITAPDDPIQVLPFNPVDYIQSNRSPASGYFYALPWQMDYITHPVGEYKIDLCRDIETTMPKAIFFDSIINIWEYKADDYLSCVKKTLVTRYLKHAQYERLWIRADIVVNKPEILQQSLAEPTLDVSVFNREQQHKLKARIGLHQPLEQNGQCILLTDALHDPLAFGSCKDKQIAQVIIDRTPEGTHIREKSSQNCLEVNNNTTEAGAALRFWPCIADSRNQLFRAVRINPDRYQLEIPFSGLCLANKENRLVQENCKQASQWTLDHME